MGDLVTQLGIGGVFALLVIREVLNFLAKRRSYSDNPGNSASSNHSMKLVAAQMAEIRQAQISILSAIDRIETIIKERLPRR